jgi:hypothetical protein
MDQKDEQKTTSRNGKTTSRNGKESVVSERNLDCDLVSRVSRKRRVSHHIRDTSGEGTLLNTIVEYLD